VTPHKKLPLANPDWQICFAGEQFEDTLNKCQTARQLTPDWEAKGIIKLNPLIKSIQLIRVMTPLTD